MEAPKLPSIFKKPVPRKFEFPTRYYNPQKERQQELREKADQGSQHLDRQDYKKQDEKLRKVRLTLILSILIISILLYLNFA